MLASSWLIWPIIIGSISMMVIIHESGHFLMARAFGMRVLRYSIGIGPVLFKYQPKNSATIFQVCAIPFLAYVQIDGMNPTDEIDPKDPALFANKSVFARIMTILAGPMANYVGASVLTFLLIMFGGVQREIPGPMVVGTIIEGSPASNAGIDLGDEVIEANGVAIHSFNELVEATRNRADQPTVYRVRRGEQVLPVMTITPHADATQGGRAVIGIVPQPTFTYDDATAGTALRYALIIPLTLTIAQAEGIADRVQHRSTEGMSSVIGMARHMRQQAREGTYAFVSTLVIISVALGFFNLLPFPALDGGRLVFLFFELITRRRANERVEAVIHMVGIVVLLCFAAYITIYRDIPG